MDLRQLDYFVHVVDAGSFSRAAVVLDLAQPTLSRQIALLEVELGQRLLVRTGRGAAPTEAGQALLVHARSMLETAQRARNELRDLQASPAGRVTVGMPPRLAQALGATLVQRFRTRFPRAVITVSEGLSVHLHEWLLAGRLDMALLFDPPTSAALATRTLLRESMVLVAPAAAPPLPRHIALAALAGYPLVLPGAPNAIRSLLEAVLRPRRVALEVVAEVGAVQTVLALVEGGVGCTVLPVSALGPPGRTLSLQWAPIGPPPVRNTLVLAEATARPSTRLARDTAALIAGLDFAAFGEGRAQPSEQAPAVRPS